MKPGNLVKINRASIGMPAGTIGLIVASWQMPNTMLHVVKLLTGRGSGRTRRFIPRDLEVISS